MPSSAAASRPGLGLLLDLAPRPAQLGPEHLGDRRTESASRSCGAARIPSRVRRSSTSATLRACSRRAAIATSASRSGRPGTIGARQLRVLPGEVEDGAGGVAVAEGELGERLLPHPLRRLQVLGRASIPSGISAVWQGASRPSRSTRRSTVCFAIRRQVVSLPPVIVSIPEEVSYSSALREMSTDLRGSPVEISGRTPA